MGTTSTGAPDQRGNPWRPPILAAVTLLLVLVAACGGSAEPGGPEASELAGTERPDPEERPAETPSSPDEPAETAAAGEDGDCDLIGPSEVEQLFAGRFVEASRSGRGARGGGCAITLQATGDVEVAAAELVVQAGPADAAQVWLDMIDELPDAQEVDLGIGGVLQGRTNLDILVDEDRSLRIGASLVLIDPATGASVFEDADVFLDQVSANLLALADTVIGRL